MKSLAIFYGWPGATNGERIQNIPPLYSQFDIVILGETLEDPTHPDHPNTIHIIQTATSLNSSILFYGYICLGNTRRHSMSTLYTKMDQWSHMGVKGIFLDEAGFDFWDSETDMKHRQQQVWSYCRSKGLRVTFNAWNPNDLKSIPFERNDAVLYEGYIFSSNPSEDYEQYRIHVDGLQSLKANGASLWGMATSKYSVKSVTREDWDFLCATALVDGMSAIGWSSVGYSAGNLDAAHLQHFPISPELEALTLLSCATMNPKSLRARAMTNKGLLTIKYQEKSFSISRSRQYLHAFKYYFTKSHYTPLCSTL
jgi:hypothetical protein